MRRCKSHDVDITFIYWVYQVILTRYDKATAFRSAFSLFTFVHYDCELWLYEIPLDQNKSFFSGWSFAFRISIKDYRLLVLFQTQIKKLSTKFTLKITQDVKIHEISAVFNVYQRKNIIGKFFLTYFKMVLWCIIQN